VLFVVNGQYGIGGRGIGDVGTKRRLLHRRFIEEVRFASGSVAVASSRTDFISSISSG